MSCKPCLDSSLMVWATVAVVGAVVVVVEVVVMVESPTIVVVVAASAEIVGASSRGVVVVAATRWTSTPALLLVLLVRLLSPHKLYRSGEALEFLPSKGSSWTSSEGPERVVGVRKGGFKMSPCRLCRMAVRWSPMVSTASASC